MSRRAPFAVAVPPIGRRREPILALGNRDGARAIVGSWAGVIETRVYRDESGVECYAVELRQHGGKGANAMSNGRLVRTLATGRLDEAAKA